MNVGISFVFPFSLGLWDCSLALPIVQCLKIVDALILFGVKVIYFGLDMWNKLVTSFCQGQRWKLWDLFYNCGIWPTMVPAYEFYD